MCKLRSWIKDEIGSAVEAANEKVLSGLEDLEARIALGFDALVGLDVHTMKIIKWYATKPPMSIWGDAWKEGEAKYIDIYLRGETLRSIWGEHKSFGLQVVYDDKFMKYSNRYFGDQMLPWLSLSANESEPGVITIGGFAGDPSNAIDPGDSIVHLCTISFDVIEAVIQAVTIKSLVDDLAAFSPKEFEVAI